MIFQNDQIQLKKMKHTVKILTFALLCISGLLSCTREIEQEITLDIPLIHNGEKLKVDIEAHCRMTLGSEITIVVLGDPGDTPCKWVSENTSVVTVDKDKITAVGLGRTNVKDENHPNRIIEVIVQNK